MQSAQDPLDQTLQQSSQSLQQDDGSVVAPAQQDGAPKTPPHQSDDTSSVLDSVVASVIQQHDPLNPAGMQSSHQQELEKRATAQAQQEPQQEAPQEPQAEPTQELIPEPPQEPQQEAPSHSEQSSSQDQEQESAQTAQVETGAGSSATEIEFSQEIESELPPEVASYLEEIKNEEIGAPPTIVSTDDDGNVHIQTYDPTIMVLPITEEVVVAGLKKSPMASIRWLAEECIKWMKKYAGKVAYKED